MILVRCLLYVRYVTGCWYVDNVGSGRIDVRPLLQARFGKKAVAKVRAKAKVLEKRGDLAGHDVWNRVADEIEKNKSKRAH